MYDVKVRKISVKMKRDRAVKIKAKEHAKLVRIWKEASREYLRAIIKENVIRVDTGMSKASLLPLARYLRMYTEVRSEIKEGPKRKGAFDIHGQWDADKYRSIKTGENSNKRKAGWNILVGSPKRMVFVFEFEITVFQYLVHENGWQEFQAWNTIEKGRAAFKEYLTSNFEPFDLKDWGIHG